MCAALTLCACGVRLPDTASYLDPCPAVIDEPISTTGSDIFFVATNLADCRKDSMRLSSYRSVDVSYGISSLGSGSTPWKRHSTLRYNHAAWLETLKSRIAYSQNDGRLLVYVHGFNNSYEDALERAMKLSRLYYQGVPVVVFSWPSRNRAVSYTYDEDSTAWTQDHFDALLTELSLVSSDITVVGHSMGNRVLLRGLLRLDGDPGARSTAVRKVVLASPDIDRHLVLRNNGMLDTILKHGSQVVIYASVSDRPLRGSRAVHGYARLGSTDCRYDVDPELRAAGKAGRCALTIQRPGLTLVDTSMVHTGDFLRHADFVDSCPVRQDLSAFLRGKELPRLRESVTSDNDSYVLIPNGRAEELGLCPDTPPS